jgi:hypothetical protein
MCRHCQLYGRLGFPRGRGVEKNHLEMSRDAVMHGACLIIRCNTDDDVVAFTDELTTTTGPPPNGTNLEKDQAVSKK